MALVCPVGHPQGVGTSFCRLCGRAYVEVPDAVVEAPEPVAPPPTQALVPEQAQPSSVAVPVGAVPPAPPVPAPSAVPPPPPAAPPAPPLPAPPVEVATATGGLQVHLPLVEHVPTHARPTPFPPAATDTTPSDLRGELLTPEQPGGTAEPGVRGLDRAALLVGGAAGFAGGALSGLLVALVT